MPPRDVVVGAADGAGIAPPPPEEARAEHEAKERTAARYIFLALNIICCPAELYCL